MFSLAFTLNKSNGTSECPNRAFLGCLLQLKEQNVQFDRNIVRSILSIDSEAKLLQTCRAYANVLPCFRDVVLECGNEAQRELFAEVGRALMFLCSPFSLKRQNVLIQHHSCIAKILAMPISVGCTLAAQPYGERLNGCKRHCATMPRNFTCSLHTWMSEQNACTLQDILVHCGEDATNFYADLQSSIFETNYPFICDGARVPPRPLEIFNPTTTTRTPPTGQPQLAGLFTVCASDSRQ
ncbi:hypothetical protein M3Y99_01811900 [Aphelenchoides fujianensis]|nr:hypothetical protein M3Y99_01811900 [Aphelenchoides fujianensis]